MKRLSNKHIQIYECVKRFCEEKGYPPSVREICAEVGLSSPSTVHAHLKTLSDWGYISRDERKPRALALQSGRRDHDKADIPILGTVAAGMPAYASEDIEGYIKCEVNGSPEDYFALRVRGESMINAGILPGDTVVVRKQPVAQSGQIVVAIFEDEATVKRLKIVDGRVWLMPENDAYLPIDATGCRILGVVKTVIRDY